MSLGPTKEILWRRGVCGTCLGAAIILVAMCSAAEDRPNILWITSEDNGPDLGAYGDTYATTPHLDGLAARGFRYLNAWSNAPVCAPARTTIISGLYATSTGGQHMRSRARMPETVRMFPEYLREAGYYCTNNSKEDYNLEKNGQVWDESSRVAHWKNRGDDQPFFAVFNFTISHEGRIRARPHTLVHDPEMAPLPPYHPDTPEVRRDWAQYYDNLTTMDALVGEKLAEIDAAGLADDTIVVYFGDHGAGMPRHKRWTYESGLRVPLIIYVPEKYRDRAPADYRAGGASERLVSFVDLAPTVLSLAGLRPPDHLEGHAFLGPYAAAPQPYAFGFRDRMDERYDMVRCVRDARYLLVRNYMPHRPYGQYLWYMFQMPTTIVWHDLYRQGKTNSVQSVFWERKPPVELYDIDQDPHQINNLAGLAEYGDVQARLHDALRHHLARTRDLGFLPEMEIHSRSGNDAPYTMARDDSRYDLLPILEAAEVAARYDTGDIPALNTLAASPDSAVRYWSAMGFLARAEDDFDAVRDGLRGLMADESPSVRVLAAEGLGRYGSAADRAQALDVLLELGNMEAHGLHTAMMAVNAIDLMDESARVALDRIKALPQTIDGIDRRFRNYIPRLLEKTLADLDADLDAK